MFSPDDDDEEAAPAGYGWEDDDYAGMNQADDYDHDGQLGNRRIPQRESPLQKLSRDAHSSLLHSNVCSHSNT